MAKKKIGILTYHRSINYGAFLQAYCLLRYVKHIVGDAVQVEIIDYTSKISYESYNRRLFQREHKKDAWKQRIGFERACRLLPLSKDKLCTDNLEQVAAFVKKQSYDMVIVGSDEVWKVDGMRGFPTAYWLNFDIGDAIRIAYAVSSRTDCERIEEEKREYIKSAISRFQYLGVRDQATCDMAAQIGGGNPCLNCDPVFLLPFVYDRKTYKEKLYKKYKIEKNTKLLGVMIPDKKIVKKIKGKLGNEYKIVALYDFQEEADVNMISIHPFEWVKVIGCLDFLVTDRFHGTVFAMKMEIPFLSIETYDKPSNSKLRYLLDSNDLVECYLVYHNGNRIYQEILERILLIAEEYDRNKIKKALVSEKQKSKSFEEALLNDLKHTEGKRKDEGDGTAYISCDTHI